LYEAGKKEASGIFSEGGLFGRKNDFLLKDAKLVQERDAKLKADKVYIDAKSVLGGAGGASDIFSGKGGTFSKIGGWLIGGGWKKLGLVGLALGSIGTAISGYQEGGIGLGASKGIGTFAGGLAGAKLGAMGGAAIGSVIPFAGTAVGGAVGGVLGGIAGMFAGDKIATAIYKGMKKLISDKDWVGSLKSGFSDAVSWLSDALSSLTDAVKNGIKWVGDKTKGVFDTVKGGIEKAITWAGGKIPESIKGPAKALFHSLAKFVSPEDAYALTTIAGTESGLNAKAKAGTSDASGAFQFTSGTWKAYSKRAGVTATSPTTASLEEQAKVAAEYLKDVKGSLAKQGMKSYTTTDLKMGWFFGPDTGAKIAKIAKENPNMTLDEMVKAGLISRQAIKANQGVFKNVRTAGDIYNYFDKDVKKWQVAVSGAVDTQGKINKELPKQLDTVKNQTDLAKEIGDNQLQEKTVRSKLVNGLNANFDAVKEQANLSDENTLSSILSSDNGVAGKQNMLGISSYLSKGIAGGKLGDVLNQTGLIGDVSSVSKGLLDAEVGKQSIFTDAIDGIKNVVGSIAGKKQGGMAGLTAGGDEFKKVPLMVEDLGLLALQLGLV
jgi:hypothetical protein